MPVKLPFECMQGFVVWYLHEKLPIVIPRADVKAFIADSSFDDPLLGLELTLAIFEGIGHFREVKNAALIFSENLKRRISENGWPYCYRFYSEQATSAFEAYISAFCFSNKNILAERYQTSIDRSVYYCFYEKKLLHNTELLSFSQSTLKFVIGSSVNFFVGLDNGDYLYFGDGSIKKLFTDEIGRLPEDAGYHVLMTASYNQR